MLSPQHLTRPAAVSAQLWLQPPASVTTPDVRPETLTGVLAFVVVPLPSSPYVLAPQHIAAPALVTAHICPLPAAIAVTPDVRPETLTGIVTLKNTFPAISSPLPSGWSRSSWSRSGRGRSG